jgi:hypothetical protein
MNKYSSLCGYFASRISYQPITLKLVFCHHIVVILQAPAPCCINRIYCATLHLFNNLALLGFPTKCGATSATSSPASSLKIIIHHFKLLYVFATMARGML